VSAADRSHLARSFDTVAGEYDRGRPVWPRAAIDWLLGPEPLDVLDVGAGTGKLTAVIAAAGHRVTAVEPMPRMREQLAARLPDVPRIAACAEQLPFAQDTFDAVLAGAAFHWFDAERALAEFARVLRPGGVVGMLGNVFDVGVPWVARLREILGPPAAERRDYWPELATLDGDFARVEERGFPHDQTIDLRTLRDLASSRSGFAVMDQAQRERQLARVDELWASEPALAGATSVRLPWIARARRCSAPLAAWRVAVVDAERVRPLRASVLRPGLPLSESTYDGDDAQDAVHLAVERDAELLAVASARPEGLPDDPRDGDWRLRGMAAQERLRGRGMGAALLAALERIVRERGGARIWCNARVGALTLYERAGYEPLGGRFVIPGIGDHVRMIRELR
jgi:SAM-dependent methyltransferase/predicted GNAT family N-acyltransferase